MPFGSWFTKIDEAPQARRPHRCLGMVSTKPVRYPLYFALANLSLLVCSFLSYSNYSGDPGGSHPTTTSTLTALGSASALAFNLKDRIAFLRAC
jgi:hypothetical protein